MPRSYAGSVSVNSTEYANNTLFFLGFEKEDGSLSAAEGERENEPWVIWLNGGYVKIRFVGVAFSPFRTDQGVRVSTVPWLEMDR